MGTTLKYNGQLNIFGPIIKEYRLQNDLSLEKLSAKLQLLGINLPSQSLHSIENDTRAIKDFELMGLVKILNIPILNLFDNFFRE